MLKVKFYQKPKFVEKHQCEGDHWNSLLVLKYRHKQECKLNISRSGLIMFQKVGFFWKNAR